MTICLLLIGCCNVTSAQDNDTKVNKTDVEANTKTDIIPGDVNGDGKVSIEDIAALISYLNGKTPSGFVSAAADLTENNMIDVNDVKTLSNIILGKNSGSVSLPVSTDPLPSDITFD